MDTPAFDLSHNTTASCACRPGTEIDYDGGSPECVVCPQGRYKQTYDNRPCGICGVSLTTLEPGASLPSQCVCETGYYMKDGVCEPCDSMTLDCKRPGTTLYTLPMRPGYWRVNHLHWQPQQTSTPGYVSDRIYPCYTRSACVGTNNLTEGALMFSMNDSNPCAEGHKGVFCAACKWPEYSMNSETRRCERCEGSQTAALVYSIVGVSVILFAMLSVCTGCLFFPAFAKQIKEALRRYSSVGILKAMDLDKLRPFIDNYFKKMNIKLDDNMWKRFKHAAATATTTEEVHTAIRDPEAFVEKILNSADFRFQLGPIALQFLKARLKPILKRVPLQKPLTWDHLWPAVELIESVEDLEDAIRDPSAFVQRLLTTAVGPAAIKLAVARLKPKLEPKLPKGLTWTELEPALCQMDSVHIIKVAIEKPDAFFQKLIGCGDSGGGVKGGSEDSDDGGGVDGGGVGLPTAGAVANGAAGKVVAIAQLRPVLEPKLSLMNLKWEDVRPVLLSKASVHQIRAAIADPEQPFLDALLHEVQMRRLTQRSTLSRARTKLLRGASAPPSPPPSPPSTYPSSPVQTTRPPSKRCSTFSSSRRRRFWGWLRSSASSSCLSAARLLVAVASEVPLRKMVTAVVRRGKWARSQPLGHGYPGQNILKLTAHAKSIYEWTRTHATTFMIKVRILISMFQVLTGINATYSIPYPHAYHQVLKWLGTIELDFVSALPLGCTMPINFHNRFLARTIFPLTVILLLKSIASVSFGISLFKDLFTRIAAGGLRKALSECWTKRRAPPSEVKETAKSDAVVDACDTAAFFIMLLVYPSCSQVVFAMFQCVPVDDGTSWLRQDLSIDCASPEHVQTSLVAYVMLLVYPLGIPSYFAYKLLWQYGASLDILKKLEARATAHNTLRNAPAYIEERAVVKLQKAFRRVTRSVQQEVHVEHALRLVEEDHSRKKLAAATEQASPQPSPPPSPPQPMTPRESLRRHLKRASSKEIWSTRGKGTKRLVSTLSKGVSDAQGLRKLARQGKMAGIVLPASILRMTAGYEYRVYWFEIIECVRKLLLTGMPVWFEMGSVLQLTFGLLVSFFSFGAYMQLRPFSDDRDDLLSVVCQAQTFLALVSSVILSSAAEDGPTSRNMGFLLCTLTALPVAMAFAMELFAGKSMRSRLLMQYVLNPVRKKLLSVRAEIGRRQRMKEKANKYHEDVSAKSGSELRTERSLSRANRRISMTAEQRNSMYQGEVSGMRARINEMTERGRLHFSDGARAKLSAARLFEGGRPGTRRSVAPSPPLAISEPPAPAAPIAATLGATLGAASVIQRSVRLRLNRRVQVAPSPAVALSEPPSASSTAESSYATRAIMVAEAARVAAEAEAAAAREAEAAATARVAEVAVALEASTERQSQAVLTALAKERTRAKMNSIVKAVRHAADKKAAVDVAVAAMQKKAAVLPSLVGTGQEAKHAEEMARTAEEAVRAQEEAVTQAISLTREECACELEAAVDAAVKAAEAAAVVKLAEALEAPKTELEAAKAEAAAELAAAMVKAQIELAETKANAEAAMAAATAEAKVAMDAAAAATAEAKVAMEAAMADAEARKEALRAAPTAVSSTAEHTLWHKAAVVRRAAALRPTASPPRRSSPGIEGAANVIQRSVRLRLNRRWRIAPAPPVALSEPPSASPTAEAAYATRAIVAAEAARVAAEAEAAAAHEAEAAATARVAELAVALEASLAEVRTLRAKLSSTTPVETTLSAAPATPSASNPAAIQFAAPSMAPTPISAANGHAAVSTTAQNPFRDNAATVRRAATLRPSTASPTRHRSPGIEGAANVIQHSMRLRLSRRWRTNPHPPVDLSQPPSRASSYTPCSPAGPEESSYVITDATGSRRSWARARRVPTTVELSRQELTAAAKAFENELEARRKLRHELNSPRAEAVRQAERQMSASRPSSAAPALTEGVERRGACSRPAGGPSSVVDVWPLSTASAPPRRSAPRFIPPRARGIIQPSQRATAADLPTFDPSRLVWR